MTIKPIPPSAETMAIVNAATSNITRAGNRQSNIRVQLPTTPLPQQQSGVVVKAVKAEGHPQHQTGPPSSVVVVAHPGHHPSAAAATGQPSVVRLPMRPTHAPIIVSPSPSQPVPTSVTPGGGLLLPVLPTTPLQIPGNSREAVTTTVSSSLDQMSSWLNTCIFNF